MSIKKYIIKILIILIILTISMMFVQKNYVSATNFIAEGKGFLTKGGDISNVIDEEALKGTSDSVFKVLLSIAICVSVIVGAVLGFQFILGSVEGKAKVSEALMPYIVGCIIVFGAFTIWKIAISIGNRVEDSIIASEPPKEEINKGGQTGANNKPQTNEEKNEFNSWYEKYIEWGDNLPEYTNNWSKDKWKDFFEYVKRNYDDINVISNNNYIRKIIKEYILHKND